MVRFGATAAGLTGSMLRSGLFQLADNQLHPAHRPELDVCTDQSDRAGGSNCQHVRRVGAMLADDQVAAECVSVASAKAPGTFLPIGRCRPSVFTICSILRNAGAGQENSYGGAKLVDVR